MTNSHHIKQLHFLQVCLTVLLVFNLTACQEKFDKEQWNEKVDWTYPHRDKMITDLTESYQLKGLTIQEIIDLLGQPDDYCISNAYELRYQVLEDYGWDIDPVHTKNLVLKLTQTDSIVGPNTTVIEFEIVEWKR